MKSIFKEVVRSLGFELTLRANYRFYSKLFKKYRDFTMTNKSRFITNLELCRQVKDLEGDYVECGVWKGGMSAAIAECLGQGRKIHLFDSFTGLPPAGQKDGEMALRWQSQSDNFDNCSVPETFVIEAMKIAHHDNYLLHKGWFDETLPQFNSTDIAVLRLDGDWFDSIWQSLEKLYPMVVENGLIIIDDYPYWVGCSRAVHKYLSEIDSTSRIREWNNVAYIIKTESIK